MPHAFIIFSLGSFWKRACSASTMARKRLYRFFRRTSCRFCMAIHLAFRCSCRFCLAVNFFSHCSAFFPHGLAFSCCLLFARCCFLLQDLAFALCPPGASKPLTCLQSWMALPKSWVVGVQPRFHCDRKPRRNSSAPEAARSFWTVSIASCTTCLKSLPSAKPAFTYWRICTMLMCMSMATSNCFRFCAVISKPVNKYVLVL